MTGSNCAVCAIKSECDRANLYLFAPTPLLFDKLESVLTQKGVPFAARQQTFALSAGAERDAVVEQLRAELSTPELRDLRVTFDLTNLIAATSLEQFGRRVDTRWFEQAIAGDEFTYWFQPIVDAAGRSVHGHECLVRLQRNEPGEAPWRSGQEIIDAAFDRGDIHIFDSYARRKAILQAKSEHTVGRVFINFTPSSIYDPAFCMASTLAAMQDTHFQPHQIVFEVVESERLANPRHLRRIAEYYRQKGFCIALDDVGTGSNSLQMIEEIQPDYIKLDKSLVWKFNTAIGSRTIRKLAELAAESGIEVIAEGVETAEMRDVLLQSGIRYMQGYFFAKPGPRMASCFPSPVLR